MPELMQDELEKPRAFGDTPEVEDEGEVEATEAEQMDYDLLVVRSRKMMYGKGRANILKMLGSSESPAKGIGKVGAMLIRSLIAAAKQGGRVISPDAAINAGEEIAQDLSDLAKANGVFQYESEEEEQKEIADALLWGAKFFGEEAMANGEITPDMQAQARKQMQEGMAAEQAQGQKQKPVAAAVGEAVRPKGVIGGAMQGGV